MAAGRLATDVGGTFTDLVSFDEATGALTLAKVLTTPANPASGVLNAIDAAGPGIGDIALFIHGTTTVINAITERKGVKTALVTTAGFRDVLEIGRGNRPDLYNLRFRSPEPFVPRDLRFEVRERVAADGSVIEALALADLDAIIDACRSASVEAIAIQFLHSYIAPAHEMACAAYLRERLPGVAVTASHEITREWREYERANTAVLNAYVAPVVRRYFDSLETALHGRGFACPLLAMQSNGGTTSFDWARAHPITLIESGPAAGVNGAVLVGRLCGEKDLILLDIGGTTAKCALLENGQPKVTTEYKLERTRTYPGYPVKVPVVDIVEIGAGGGSIAWFDRAGALKVGPVSAAASPGPACYGLGGTGATVTDAKLLTGVIDAASFAGGQMTLDLAAAERAMAPIAERLGVGLVEAAQSVIRVAEANMINALKLVSIQRGHDPRDFVLVASGGGGPMHAGALGRELGIKEIVIPLYPGLFSAWGMLATAPRRDFARSEPRKAEATAIEDVGRVFAEMEVEARAYFSEGRVAAPVLSFAHAIDMRYRGQEHTVAVPVDPAGSMAAILAAFHLQHERAFTFALADAAVELVTFHLDSRAELRMPEMRPIDATGRSAKLARRGSRLVDFAEEGRHEVEIYRRDLLPAGFAAAGPLLVEEDSSTTLVHPGQSLSVDALGFLRIS